jgi:hypothetical protein
MGHRLRLDLDRSTRGESRSLTMTVRSAANLRRAALPVATLCRPDSKNAKTGLKLGQIEPRKKAGKRLRQFCRQDCRMALRLLFPAKVLMGGGSWLRNTGRGLQSGLRRSRSFNSRQSPVAHDDGLRRGEFAPRDLI